MVSVEICPSNKTNCIECGTPIHEGTIRINVMVGEFRGNPRYVRWHHDCFMRFMENMIRKMKIKASRNGKKITATHRWLPI